jgi:hypothetical protein
MEGKMKKFYIFNLVVFIVLLLTFISGSNMSNEIRYTFAGNSFLNPVSGEILQLSGIVMQVFSGIGMVVQLVMVNLKLIQDSKKV